VSGSRSKRRIDAVPEVRQERVQMHVDFHVLQIRTMFISAQKATTHHSTAGKPRVTFDIRARLSSIG